MIRSLRPSAQFAAYRLSNQRTFSAAQILSKKKGSGHADSGNSVASSGSAGGNAGGFDSAGMKRALEGTLKNFEEKIKEARANTISTEKFQNLDVDLGNGASSASKGLATIAARGNKIIIVAFDPKQVKRIQTAIISTSGMPAELSNSDKQTSSVNVPQQTEAKKTATLKSIKESFESSRNNANNKHSVASIRAKYLNPLKKAAAKNTGVSKDDVKKQTQEIEQLVKTYSTKLQDLFKKSSS